MYKKRYLIIGLFIFSLFLFSNSAKAEITFDKASPQILGTEVFITCSIGDNYFIYKPDESMIDAGDMCLSGVLNIGLSNEDLGIIYYIECDNSENYCDSLTDENNDTLTEARNNQGFISETTFTWTASGSPSDGAINTLDTLGTVIVNTSVDTGSNVFQNYWPLFLILGIIFFLIFWGRKLIRIGRGK